MRTWNPCRARLLAALALEQALAQQLGAAARRVLARRRLRLQPQAALVAALRARAALLRGQPRRSGATSTFLLQLCALECRC
jgi:hypothetical protein